MHMAASTRGASAGATPGSMPWGALGLLLALYILSFVDRQIIALMVGPIRTSLGIDNVQIAMVHGVAFSLFYALAGLPFGWLVDWGQPRWIIFAGVMGWSVATVLCGLASSFELLFLGRLGVGIGEAALLPAAFAILGHIVPRERMALASSVFMVGSLVGGGIAFAVGGSVITLLSHSATVELPLLGVVEPWRAAFILVGLPGIALAFAAMLLPAIGERRRAVEVARTTDAIGFGAFLARNRRFVGTHLGGFALLGCAAFAGQAWGPAHMAADFGWSPAQSGFAFAVIVGGCGSAGTFLAAAVVDRLYRRGLKDAHDRYHMWVALLTAPIAAGAFLAPGPWAFVGMMGIAYLTFFSFGGTATAALQIVAPEHLRGRVASLYGIAMAAGGSALGPLMVALIGRHVLGDDDRIGEASAICVALCAAGAVVLLALARPAFVAAQEPAHT